MAKKTTSTKASSTTSSLNQVTSFSKVLAAVLFIVLPFVAFFMGMKYQFLATETMCAIYSSKYN